MVVFVDLEDESEPPEDPRLRSHWDMNGHAGIIGRFGVGHTVADKETEKDEERGESRDNPNKTAFTEALACYPVIISIASHIDLNTLDALSRTCRQVRANLLQFRTQLLQSTLHCENEKVELDPDNTFRYRARAADWYFVDIGRATAVDTGKVGDCARDMVNGCRRCGRVVCRNCTIKPPAPVLLQHRHRRICKACAKAPLTSFISPSLEPEQSIILASSTKNEKDTLRKEALKLSICNCVNEGVWLCQPCGRSLRSADSEYASVWKWRTRYLPSLGGLGTGIGEGDRGVACGRGKECVAGRMVEEEIDCDAEDLRESDISSRAGSPSSSPPSSINGSYTSSSAQMGPGYTRHEIEGIGGVVKKKLVRMVKVGACVPEFGDEKESGKVLAKEVEGKARSWCGWCWRVIPGAKDVVA
ncbi:hypothetical protein B0J14DRAFT_589649 [Halenospora varia]|nr:hypothetical protein B0J14DRAFT_589649 [Halenospora varia]